MCYTALYLNTQIRCVNGQIIIIIKRSQPFYLDRSQEIKFHLATGDEKWLFVLLNSSLLWLYCKFCGLLNVLCNQLFKSDGIFTQPVHFAKNTDLVQSCVPHETCTALYF